MIALWMAYATFVGGLVGVAAGAAERIAGATLRQRRWVWVFALMLSVAIPSWAVLRPAVPAGPGPAQVDSADRSVAPAPENTVVAARLAELIARADAESLVRFDTPFIIAWAVAVTLALAAYGAANWSLARRRRSWRSAIVDGQTVLLAPGVGPAVVGTLRPRIVVPEWALGLPDEQRALMLEHERQHVRANDPLVLHVAAMIALLMPWNIAAWWLNRRLRLAVELDCDARVLARGGDPAVYGTLLLDVCSRPRRPGALLSPALLERTSSLAKRILAMYPNRLRFARWRIALGATAALGLVIAACEMPSPEILAPTGKNEASQRLYGKIEAMKGPDGILDLRKTVARHFPAIARGEGGPSILFVVRSAAGEIVLTEVQPASDLARTPMRQDGEREARPEPSQPAHDAVGLAMRVRAMPAEVVKLRAYHGEPSESTPRMGEPHEATVPPHGAERVKIRQNFAFAIPSGVGALEPDDIATIDVSKHAAGTLAPNAVSVISIVLKEGAAVPLMVRAP
jgi:beta-lactamase regulating signal transducer with metallopeptidase domain